MAKVVDLIRMNQVPKFKVRKHNRCHLCGRSRAYYRRFGLCRLCLRALSLRGEIPGVRKASW
ncbi:MAG: type Z 30S ribosomal protein S14 [Chloroflexi bacterium]|nr:type Z 30S ribosomal protein S14 [Chloroflexota bacterium]